MQTKSSNTAIRGTTLFRQLILPSIIAVLLAGAAIPASADFASDTTPVDMRNYYPNANIINTYRRYDSSLYMKRMTKANNSPMYYWLPDQSGTHFSREDYFDPNNPTDETPPYNNSWGFRHGSSTDMSVMEVADLISDSSCSSWCWSPGQYYVNPTSPNYPDGIVHGKAAGHVLGESYYVLMDHDVYWAEHPDYQTPTNISSGVWSAVAMIEKHNSYTPAYGRNGGAFGSGNAQTFYDVIAVGFVHGTKGSGPNCDSERPNWATHQSGYVTFWQKKYLAPGKGEIVEETLFDERNCGGTQATQNPSQGYIAYHDTYSTY